MISHSAPTIGKNDLAALGRTLRSGMIASGEACAAFTDHLKDYFGAQEVYLTNSGSSSLFFALHLLGSKKKEIILPTYVCKDVHEAVVTAGFIPVYCDIGAGWNISAETVKKKISQRTAAIIVTNNLGIACNVKELQTLGIPVIEDCCQSFGARHNKILSGTLADISVLSFNATKCLTTGEGGAIIINNKKIIANKKNATSLQHILRMSDLQATIGIQQLKAYGVFMKRRKEIASDYFNGLAPALTGTFRHHSSNSNFFRFLLFVKHDYKETAGRFLHRGIVVRKGIDQLLHRQYKSGNDKQFPNSVDHFKHTLSLPIYPSLSKENVQAIIKVTNSVFK